MHKSEFHKVKYMYMFFAAENYFLVAKTEHFIRISADRLGYVGQKQRKIMFFKHILDIFWLKILVNVH